MSEDENFKRIMEGLQEALAHAEGQTVPGLRIHIPDAIDTKAIRTRMGLTQVEFAQRYGFSAGAVRDWEQGRRVPEAGARAFLTVLSKEPEAVERALSK